MSSKDIKAQGGPTPPTSMKPHSDPSLLMALAKHKEKQFGKTAPREGKSGGKNTTNSLRRNKGKAAVVKASHKEAVGRSIKRIDALLQTKSALLKQKEDFDRKYVAVDSKGLSDSPYADKLKVIDLQLKEERAMVQDMIGQNIITLEQCYVPTVFDAQSGGLIDQCAVDPSLTSTFAGAAALFSEFRVTEVQIDVWPTAFGGVPTVGATAQNGFGVIIYDAADPTALTTRAVAVNADHKLLVPVTMTVLSTNSPITVQTHPLSLKVKVPSGILISAGESSTNSMSGWQPTSGNGSSAFIPYGWVKAFFQGLANTNNTQVFDCLIRMKTEYRIQNA